MDGASCLKMFDLGSPALPENRLALLQFMVFHGLPMKDIAGPPADNDFSLESHAVGRLVLRPEKRIPL